MLPRFWEKDFQKHLLQKKKKRIKKHKAEFIVFLEKKYGKEYYNKAVSERELIRDINEFEAYREEKNLTNVDKKTKKAPAKKTETTNPHKHKLKPKRAPKRVWLLSDGKVNESPVFEEDDEEEYTPANRKPKWIKEIENGQVLIETSKREKQRRIKETEKAPKQKDKNKNIQKYKLKPKRGCKTRFWLV